MNEIRKNKEDEIEIVQAKFTIPWIYTILTIFYILTISILFIIFIVFDYNLENSIINHKPNTSINWRYYIFFICLYCLFFLSILFFIIRLASIRKCNLVVTNKRIYGTMFNILTRKKYSYRLDEIENVEETSRLGIHGLLLNFSQGYGPQGTIRFNRDVGTMNGVGVVKISYILNINEVYEKLSELITSVKNDKDLIVDIEMSKIDTENRKAAALEKMSTNIYDNNSLTTNKKSNYIEELKGLKELLDSGVITEQEFEQKKKELLNK